MYGWIRAWFLGLYILQLNTKIEKKNIIHMNEFHYTHTAFIKWGN